MIDTDTAEPDAGAIADPQQLRVELAKALVDYRDGTSDGIEEAIDRILEVTGHEETIELVITVGALPQEPLGYITYRTKSGAVTSAFGHFSKGIAMPPRSTLLAAGLVGASTPQPPTATLGHSIGSLRDPV